MSENPAEENPVEQDLKLIPSVPVYLLVPENSEFSGEAVLQYAKPSQLPKDGYFYVIAKDEVLLHKGTSQVFDGLVSVNEVAFLDSSLGTGIKSKLPKIPGTLIARSHRFFQRVFKEHGAEAELMLLYDFEQKRFALWCPKQHVSRGGVDYQLSEEFLKARSIGGNWVDVGTIHSHCNFDAFHSGTDTNDEKNSDGIHITIGHVDKENFSMVSSLVSNNNRKQVDCEEVVADLNDETKDNTRSILGMKFGRVQNFYNVALTEEEKHQLDEFEKETIDKWMTRVKPGSFSWSRDGKKVDK